MTRKQGPGSSALFHLRKRLFGLTGVRRRTPLPPLAELRAFHIGGYWRGPNDTVRQMMQGLRSTGASVYEFNTDEHPEALDCEGRPYDRGTFGPVWLRWEVLEEKVETFRPDLIICNAGGLSFRPRVAGRLRKTAVLLGIALSDPDVFVAATSQIAPNFDLFLTNAPACVPRYAERGARAVVLPIATNEQFFRPVPGRREYECEVVMFGAAHADRVEPVRAVSQRFDLHLYGEGWDEHGLPSRGTLYGDAVLSALNSAKMTLVFFRTPAGHPLVKVHVFDFLAAGALVVTNYFEELEKYLAYGKDLVGFDSTPALIEQIRHYLDHPAEAEAIRAAGRARVLRDHTWRQVWPGIVEQVNAVR